MSKIDTDTGVNVGVYHIIAYFVSSVQHGLTMVQNMCFSLFLPYAFQMYTMKLRVPNKFKKSI